MKGAGQQEAYMARVIPGSFFFFQYWIYRAAIGFLPSAGPAGPLEAGVMEDGGI